MLCGRLEAWGPQVILDGAGVAFTRTEPNATGFSQSAHMLLVHLAGEPQWSVAVNSDRKFTGFAPVGAIEIVPAGSEASASWTTRKQSLRVDIEQARLERLAGAEFDREAFELQPPKFGYIDRQLHATALLAHSELNGPNSFSGAALDALVTLCSIHLLRTYSSLRGNRFSRATGGLSPAVLNRVESYIQDHLEKSLSLERLASIACLSPSHFLRAFKKNTGQTPHQFVIAARMARARDLILKTDLSFGQIAMATGFSSHNHMTTLMKRAWGATPSEIRR